MPILLFVTSIEGVLMPIIKYWKKVTLMSILFSLVIVTVVISRPDSVTTKNRALAIAYAGCSFGVFNNDKKSNWTTQQGLLLGLDLELKKLGLYESKFSGKLMQDWEPYNQFAVEAFASAAQL
jgi:hypothetical protein